MISSPVEKIVANLLQDYADKIKSGNTHLNIEEATNIISTIAHIELTKEEACDYLNISRSRFGELIAEGKIPKGRKIKGYKELRWKKKDLLNITGNKCSP